MCGIVAADKCPTAMFLPALLHISVARASRYTPVLIPFNLLTVFDCSRLIPASATGMRQLHIAAHRSALEKKSGPHQPRLFMSFLSLPFFGGCLARIIL